MRAEDWLRIGFVQRAAAGRSTAQVGADALGLSLRQMRRLIRAYREKGGEGLIHGNRGRVSARRISDQIREQIMGLLQGEYGDYNTSAVRDALEEEHGIQVSYTFVYRLRKAAGLCSPRHYKTRAHRRRRERAAQEGQLLQTDGSDHDWLEGRGPSLSLIAYIDDATGKIAGACFREQEDATGYLQALASICKSQGIPQALYTDQHTIFQSPAKLSVEQKLRGEKRLSQVGRIFDQLGIVHQVAHSPQAKGRVERLFGTLQDRLTKELRRQHAATLTDANQVLQAYLPRFNQRFGKPAAVPDPVYRPWPQELEAEQVFSFRYTRVVANDNTIAFSGLKLPIPPGPRRRSYAKASVTVLLHLDGQLSIHYQNQRLATFRHAPDVPVRVDHFIPAEPIVYAPTPPLASELAAVDPPSSPQAQRPGPDHPWRRSYKSNSSDVHTAG